MAAGVAVDAAEVALPVDQRVAHREVLREPDQRVVHRLVAVRVVLADHVADHARRLLVRLQHACCAAGPSRTTPDGGTGLRPSRTSGSARLMMTLIA
jgi:hypothetical protein